MNEVDFTSVYARHAGDVYRFALYLSGDVHAAEDVTAETFARAWTARGRIQIGSVKAYLLAIARNLCHDAHRRQAPRPLSEDLDVADQAPDQERSAGAREEWRDIVRDLRTLSEIDRSILIMATLEDMNYRAIGEAVGLSEAAVKVRVHRARLHLNVNRQRKALQS